MKPCSFHVDISELSRDAGGIPSSSLMGSLWTEIEAEAATVQVSPLGSESSSPSGAAWLMPCGAKTGCP